MRFECIDCGLIVGPEDGDGPDFYLCEECALNRIFSGEER